MEFANPEGSFDLSAGEGDDTITASDLDSLRGSGEPFTGDVILHGDGGEDLIDASASTYGFIIEGGSGAVWIAGGSGSDRIFGGTENDIIFANDGDDINYCGSGDDIIHGQRGDDTIDGGAGEDELYGELGDDTLAGGEGHDIILGDVGTIIRAYNEDGTPRLNPNGSWHMWSHCP